MQKPSQFREGLSVYLKKDKCLLWTVRQIWRQVKMIVIIGCFSCLCFGTPELVCVHSGAEYASSFGGWSLEHWMVTALDFAVGWGTSSQSQLSRTYGLLLDVASGSPVIQCQPARHFSAAEWLASAGCCPRCPEDGLAWTRVQAVALCWGVRELPLCASRSAFPFPLLP